MEKFLGSIRETYAYRWIQTLSDKGIRALVIAPDGREVEVNLPRKRVSIDSAAKQITIERWLAEKVGLEKPINKHKQITNKHHTEGGIHGRV